MAKTKSPTITGPQVSTPGGRRFVTTPEMYDPDELRPTYNMAIVAGTFFFRSTPWLRQKIRTVQVDQAKARGSYSEEGVLLTSPLEDDLGPIDPPRTESNHHAWRLYDIERMAHLFARNSIIEGEHLVLIIQTVKLQAKGYGFLA